MSPRSTLTVNGRVSLRRRRWQDRTAAVGARSGGATVPADALLDAAEATVSRGTRQLCCDLNATGRSFRRTAVNLKQAAQLVISAESLRQLVEAEGRRVLRVVESGVLTPAWKAGDCHVRTPAGTEVSRVYLGVDGFMVPVLTEAEKAARRTQVVAARSKRPRDQPRLPALPRRRRHGADQRYKEFKLVQFHDESMAHRLLSVTHRNCQEAGRIMRRDARRIALQDADERVGIVDGAAWISTQIDERCIPLTVLLLDFFHLGEHVNAGRRATFGGDACPAGQQWAGDLMHTVRHDGYAPFWDRLLRWRSGQRSRSKRGDADQLLHYVSGHEQMIHYDACERRGWRIGSSTTESQCGVVPTRVKGCGKRWDADNAEAVMALEAMHQSNQCNDYWSTCACSVN
jgi:hypothetical protein